MTARTLQELALVNNRSWHGRTQEWMDTFTVHTIAALISEIDQRRVLVGERTSYMSDSPEDWMAELVGSGSKAYKVLEGLGK
jgi:hypothetical protein